MGPFSVIYADPPWRFASNSAALPGRNPMRHYPCMTDADICALPVREWAAPSAVLLMWTTAPMLERSLAIPRAWGFRYKSNVVWNKGRIGTGYWARNRHEHLLICTRGKFSCPRSPVLFPDSVIESRRREHSRKPDAVAARIEEIWPELPKLELFARQRRFGWTVFGNETDRFDQP